MYQYKFITDIDKEFSKSGTSISKYYIWDEIAYANYLLEIGSPVSNYIFKDVYVLAKYFYHIKQWDDEDIFNNLKEFSLYNKFSHLWSYDKKEYYLQKIKKAILLSKKQNMKVFNEIRITKNEIDSINNMSDITTRKIAFVMLCMWKANGNKPFRSSIHQIANEIEIKANGKKLNDIYFTLLREEFIYRYNRTAEQRKNILEKLIEIDSQYGQLFIPYDSLKYAQHVSSPTRKSSIAIWRHIQEYNETPDLKLPSYYEKMTTEEKERYKQFRHEINEDDYYGDDELDGLLESVDLEYIKQNMLSIIRVYSRDQFARIIGGEVFYHEEQAHNKVKVLFDDKDDSEGKIINVNDIKTEFDNLFGKNTLVFGKCVECNCKIVKKSNKTKYCEDCREKVRKEKVKVNMRKLRSNSK